MATRIPAKSILKQQPNKKTKTPTVTDEQKAQAEKDQRNLSIALHHANLIQRQKDITSQILDSMIHLLDFPTSDPFTQKDAQTLTRLLEPFQPSDFDNLIEERRIDNKCGYCLCSRQPRSQTLGTSTAWKLKAAGSADFCSNVCARKAVYLKAQLSEVPAWERDGSHRVEILLHEDDRPPPTEDDGAGRRARRAERVEDWRRKVAGEDEEELARERGERKGGFRANEVLAKRVVEKVPGEYKAPVPPGEGEGVVGVFGAIEGYEPRHLSEFKMVERSRLRDESDEDEEEEEQEEDED